MNPLFTGVIWRILRTKRTCPTCKKDQHVSLSKRYVRVRCKFCGAVMPRRNNSAENILLLRALIGSRIRIMLMLLSKSL